MSANQPDGPQPDDDLGPERLTWRAALPFLLAVAAVVIVLVVILVSASCRPAEDRVSEDAQVQFVVNDLYSARNSLNYELYRKSRCAADVAADDFPTAAEFADANRGPRDRDGQLVIPDMDVEVAGDRAAVTVHVHRENREDQKFRTDLVVVKEDGEWKVCNS